MELLNWELKKVNMYRLPIMKVREWKRKIEAAKKIAGMNALDNSGGPYSLKFLVNTSKIK